MIELRKKVKLKMNENPKNDKKNKYKEENREKPSNNRITYGMCFGMLVGGIALTICTKYGHPAAGGTCVGIGVLVGLLFGYISSKKNK